MDNRSLIDHIPSLRRYARVLTGNAWAADDLVQDTLERACIKLRLWTVGTDLRAWLFTVMHNVFANQVRHNAPAASAAAVDVEEVAHTLSGTPVDIDRSIDLQRCVLLLPEDQRAVLLLVALEDMSYAQVAVVLGIPVGTVMSRLSRARSRLHDLMEGTARASGSLASPASVRPPLRRLK